MSSVLHLPILNFHFQSLGKFPISIKPWVLFRASSTCTHSSFSSTLKCSGYHSAIKILLPWHHLCTYIYLLLWADTISQVPFLPSFWLGPPTEAVLPSALVWAKTPPTVGKTEHIWEKLSCTVLNSMVIHSLLFLNQVRNCGCIKRVTFMYVIQNSWNLFWSTHATRMVITVSM